MLVDKPTLIQMIKDELTAGIVNLELDDDVIERNLKRTIGLSSDYFNYTTYKTMPVTKTSSSGGYVNLSDIDESGNIPVIIKVFPTSNLVNIDAAILGLGSIFVSVGKDLSNQLSSYATMLQTVANIESMLGRNARVVGDKLYLDKYYGAVTIEYIPQEVKIENINEGAWIQFIIDYTSALCKRQMAQSRGKYVIDSNPAKTNAAELLQEANTTIKELEESLETRGVILASR